MEILKAFYRTSPFKSCSRPYIEGPDAGLGGSWADQSRSLVPPTSGEGTEPVLLCPCYQFSLSCDEGWSHLHYEHRAQLSCFNVYWEAEKAFLGLLRAGKVQHGSMISSLMIAIWGDTGHRCRRTMDSDTVLSSSSPGWQDDRMTSWLWVEALATHIRMALVVTWPPDTNKSKVLASNPGFCVTFGAMWVLDFKPWQDYGPWKQQGLDATIPPGGSLGHPDSHSPSSKCGPWTPMWAQTLGFHLAFDGNKNFGHQHRPCCNMVIDPDMALSCISHPDITMTLGLSASHSTLGGSRCSMASQTPTWTHVADLPLSEITRPLVATGDRVVNLDPGHYFMSIPYKLPLLTAASSL